MAGAASSPRHRLPSKAQKRRTVRILFAGPDAELLMSNTGEDRKEGLHLSDILARMAWEKDKKYHPDAPKDLMVFEQGFTWEAILERALAHRHQRAAGSRPEQLQEDGIWLSPDWIGPDGHEEWKATKKSINSADQKVQEWLPQAQCYVRALLRRGLIKHAITTFRVWFINGDYTYESKNSDLTLLRDYRRIVIEFQKRELEERWSGVLAFARRFGFLKEDKPWDRRPSLERRVQERQWRSQNEIKTTAAKSANGNPPKRSRKPAAIVTFPTSRVKASRRADA